MDYRLLIIILYAKLFFRSFLPNIITQINTSITIIFTNIIIFLGIIFYKLTSNKQ